MIVILKPNTPKSEIDALIDKITGFGVQVSPVIGTELSILGLVGDTSKIDPTQIEANRNVDKVLHVAEPFKKANKMFHPMPTVVDVGGVKVGGKQLAIIAGPCSVETEAQIVGVAKDVKAAGAEATGLPIVTEIMSPYDIDRFVQDVDVIQVGARNMQNFDLLRLLGQTRKPILLKRGLSATIEEWLMAAEYIMAGGNGQVILCERGIRTFETYTRNTLDLSAIVAVKNLSHLPIIVDPSHATGKWWMVEPLARAAVAVGADGLIIEVHNDPAHALCDGNQSIKPAVFADVMKQIKGIADVVGREV